jgi:prepilin-type N-terminal cleavage/methylation domain-containing protein
MIMRIPCFNVRCMRKTGEKGYTLVEILVAAVIIAIAIVAMIAVMRKGLDIELNDMHRRNARAVICGKMESRYYSNANYGSLTAGTVTENDTLDSKPVVVGTLTTTITGPTLKVNNNGVDVSYKTISMWMRWAEKKFNDTLKIEKWVCDIN